MLLSVAGCLGRKLYAAKRETAAAVFIQKYIRLWLVKRAYAKISLAAVVIQSNIRGFLTRQKFLHGKKHKAATLIQVNPLLFIFICFIAICFNS